MSSIMYRFFYHYYKQHKCLSIHFKGKCYKVKDIICNVPTESKWNNSQPNLVMRGWANDVIIENEIAYING